MNASPIRRAAMTWAICLGALGLGSSALGAGPSDEDDAGETEAKLIRLDARRQLGGTEEGSLAQPAVLSDLAVVDRTCRALGAKKMKDADANAFERGRARHEEKIQRRSLGLRAFTVDIAPGAFNLDDYEFGARRLPIRVDKSIAAFEGALLLNVMDRRGAGFQLTPDEARGLAERIAARRMTLRIVFVPDVSQDFAACFSYPGSDTFNLRIRPLAFELVDENGAIAARARTPHLMKLRSWIEPGAAALKIKAEHAVDHRDETALVDALEGKRSELEACLEPVTSSATETALVTFESVLSSKGRLTEVRSSMEAIDHEDPVSCLQRVLEAVQVPATRKGRPVQVSFVVERSGEMGPPEGVGLD